MSEEQEVIVPEEFIKVIKDFTNDLKITFPEYTPLIDKWWKTKEHYNYIEEEDDRVKAYEKYEKKASKSVFEFCKAKFPPRFFDILYQNDEIFKAESDLDTEFLPNIHFKNLWQCDISDKTRETIWKYLQLLLFSIIGKLDDKSAFGDTAKLFEAINQDDFKNKLEETLGQMQDLFDLSGNMSENLGEGLNSDDLPDPSEINDHISGMLDGKIGQLAKEIAEETAKDLGNDFNETCDMKDMFNKLIKNPSKLMSLVNTVGDKIQKKIKSGEVKESELISEATDLMNKMKSMPGMGNIKSMLSKMGMDLGGANLNTGAMESKLKRQMQIAKTKERIRAKAEANAKAKAEQQLFDMMQKPQEQFKPQVSDEELMKLFSAEEKVERTPRRAPTQGQTQTQGQTEKKGKGKKK